MENEYNDNVIKLGDRIHEAFAYEGEKSICAAVNDKRCRWCNVCFYDPAAFCICAGQYGKYGYGNIYSCEYGVTEHRFICRGLALCKIHEGKGTDMGNVVCACSICFYCVSSVYHWRRAYGAGAFKIAADAACGCDRRSFGCK